jgi:hypothetical protein
LKLVVSNLSSRPLVRHSSLLLNESKKYSIAIHSVKPPVFAVFNTTSSSGSPGPEVAVERPTVVLYCTVQHVARVNREARRETNPMIRSSTR